jgi:chemotaxis-related protein WspB
MELYLQIQTGADGYLLEAARVARVLPMLQIKRLPGAAASVAGIVNYQGAPVPVLDLCELFLGRPATPHLSTRLILISVAACRRTETSGGDRLVGLLAEKVSDTIRLEPLDFISEEIRSEGAPYLGVMARANGRLWQRIELPKLLSTNLLETLFGNPGGSA